MTFSAETETLRVIFKDEAGGFGPVSVIHVEQYEASVAEIQKEAGIEVGSPMIPFGAEPDGITVSDKWLSRKQAEQIAADYGAELEEA